jgi:hypothetical protein
MAQSLYTLEGVYFVAGRDYLLDGKQIHAGDVVENANELRNVESFVRSRHLIPVVDDHNDVPVYYQKDVKLASLVEQKFGLKIKHPEDPEDFAPEEHTIPEVLEFVEEHPELTEEVLEAEEQGKDRVTLETKLEEKLDEFRPEEHTVPEVLEYVGDDQERASNVLAAEIDGKNRSTLTGPLEELLTAPEEDSTDAGS